MISTNSIKNLYSNLEGNIPYIKDYLIIKTAGIKKCYNDMIYICDIYFDDDLYLNYERLILPQNIKYYNMIVNDIKNKNNLDKNVFIVLLNFDTPELHQKIKNILWINNINDKFKIKNYKKGTFEIPYLITMSKSIFDILNSSTFDNKPSIYHLIQYKYIDNLIILQKYNFSNKKINIEKINFPHIFAEIIFIMIKNMLYTDDYFLNNIVNYLYIYYKKFNICNINIFQEYNSIYQILNDLIFVYLAYSLPYEYDDYNTSLVNIYNSSLVNLEKNIYFENYLLNSASDALHIIHTAISIFTKENLNDNKIVQLNFGNIGSHIDPDTNDSVYHEYSEVKTYNNESNKATIYFVGLNSNHYLNKGITDIQWEFNINELLNKGVFVTLVIDMTLEYYKPNLIEFYSKRYKKYINEQKLIIFYIKSFQKYVLLGSGKIKFGGIGIICNNNNKYFDGIIKYCQNYSKKIFEVNIRNVQLLIHYLKYCRELELKYVEYIIDNIKNLKKTNWWIQNEDLLLSNGSFVYLNKNIGSCEDILIKYFPKAISYGETITTWSFGNSKYFRISIGVEPFEILNQKFKDIFDSCKKYEISYDFYEFENDYNYDSNCIDCIEDRR
jgi:hypothetical protein